MRLRVAVLRGRGDDEQSVDDAEDLSDRAGEQRVLRAGERLGVAAHREQRFAVVHECTALA